jgi:phosphohistidine phosphatase
MREVWLMRHGSAEGVARGGDAARRLTPDGEQTSRAVARSLARTGLRPDAMWCSSFVRAEQTARLVAEELGFQGDLHVDEGLTPHGHAPACAEDVFAARARRLLIISHLPLVPALTAELLGADVRVDVGTSAVVHLAVLGAQGARGSCILAGLYRAETLASLSPQ